MNATTSNAEYTRVSDDATVLCVQHAMPKAVNLLEQRSPDHRRWRGAFREVAWTAGAVLEGRRRRWMQGAVRALLTDTIQDPWLRRELAIDVRSAGDDFAADDLLPRWTPRMLWRLADLAGLPMSYVAHVTQLPKHIDAPIDTAQVVRDFRRTAKAHIREARTLTSHIAPTVDPTRMPAQDMVYSIHAETHRDAALRWRELARVLAHPPS